MGTFCIENARARKQRDLRGNAFQTPGPTAPRRAARKVEDDEPLSFVRRPLLYSRDETISTLTGFSHSAFARGVEVGGTVRNCNVQSENAKVMARIKKLINFCKRKTRHFLRLQQFSMMIYDDVRFHESVMSRA